MRLLGLIFCLFYGSISLGYPNFISYGYKSCLTCHFNGNGGGPLNDYGRALFASEFTARTFTDKSPDKLADESGFLGSTELPYWIRPSLKYRGLWLRSDVASSKQADRWINMQGDFDVALNADKKNDYTVVINFGYVPTPRRFQSSNEEKPAQYISKSHYFRWQIDKGLILYAGLIDKAFGIRHADHTAVNRSLIGLGYSDQSDGLILQKITDTYDVSANGFVGNLGQDKDLRQVGFSLTGEYYLDKMFTVGGSVLSSESTYKAEKRYAFMSRLGFTKGKSFIFELGLYDNASKTTLEKSNKGYYSFLQGLILLSQGYNFITTFQTFKPDVDSTTSAESNSLGLGFMIFPIQRTEFRFELVNVRSVAQENTSPDQWNLQSQVHVAW
jgi:hypothetical protein